MEKSINKQEAIKLARNIFEKDNLAEAEKINGKNLWEMAKKGEAKWHEAYIGWYTFYKIRGDFYQSLEEKYEIYVPDRRAFQIKASDKKHHWYSFHCHTKTLHLYPDMTQGLTHKDAPLDTHSHSVENIEL